MSSAGGWEVWPELMGGSCWGHFITRNHTVKFLDLNKMLFDDRGVAGERERSGLGRNQGKWGSTARGRAGCPGWGEGATYHQVQACCLKRSFPGCKKANSGLEWN